MMKRIFDNFRTKLFAAVVGLMVLPLHSQTTPLISRESGDPGAGSSHYFFNFLTQAQRDELSNAQGAALTGNSDLSTQEMALQSRREALHVNSNPTKTDTMAFEEANKRFRESLRAAELKIDPTLQTIFDQIDKHHDYKLANGM